jgi:Lrp/AsnC family transcriptional regulator
MDTLDKTDRKILALLQKDNSLSAAQIAQEIDLSQSPCWRRINRLQEAGFIARSVAILDRKKLGLKVVVFVHVKLSMHGWNMLNEFEEAIVSFPEVLECWTISGGMDFTLRVVTHDIDSYENFLRKKLLQLPHVKEAQSHFTMTEVKNTTELPLDTI